MVVSTWILVAIVAIHHQATEIQAASRIHKIFSSRDSETDVDAILKYLDNERSREEASRTHEEPGIPICQREGQTTEKVLGGTIAPEEWGQWFVEIHNDSGLICGGTRISAKLILTSAHCFFKARPQNKEKGEHCLDNIPGHPIARLRPANMSLQDVSIIRVYKNEQFSKLHGSKLIYWSDVAIAILSTTFESPFVAGFCLMRHHKEEDKCYAVGVGYTDKVHDAASTNRARPQQLMTADVVPNNCTKIVEFHPHMDDIVCITDGAGKGDSGGPVLCNRTGYGKPYILGIMSQVWYNEDATTLHKTTKIRHDSHWIRNFPNSTAAKSDRCHENEEQGALAG